MKLFLVRSLVVLLVLLPMVVFAEAHPAAVATKSPFAVPTGLRGRVDFWIDVFTKYGKYQAVLHHREFPQVVFATIDLTDYAARMNDAEFERFRTQRVKAVTAEIEEDLRHLSMGASPRNERQRAIARSMEFLPGNVAKYRRIVSEDLIRSQTGIKEKYAAAIQRSGRYLPHMERIFREQGLPVELTRLPFIESSFDYTARSSVAAVGIWQFMKSTGKQYMKITGAVDERRDPIEATIAAAQYLRYAYSRIGNWPLAVTSYNHGVGGVLNKVRDAGTTNIVAIVENPTKRYFGFASTNFYPEFLAAVEVYRAREQFFPGLAIEPPLRFDSIELQQPLSVAAIMQRLGVTRDQLERLNYAILEPTWRGQLRLPAGYNLRVPSGFAARASLLRVPERVPSDSASTSSAVYGGMTYKVRKGDTLSSIAKRFHVTVAEILEMNRLADTQLRVGQVLRVTKRESKPERKLEASTERRAPEGSSYIVRPGDTLYDIARRAGVSVEALKRSNGMRRSAIRPGQVLKLPSKS